jgi:hypothetical protein
MSRHPNPLSVHRVIADLVRALSAEIMGEGARWGQVSRTRNRPVFARLASVSTHTEDPTPPTLSLYRRHDGGISIRECGITLQGSSHNVRSMVVRGFGGFIMGIGGQGVRFTVTIAAFTSFCTRPMLRPRARPALTAASRAVQRQRRRSRQANTCPRVDAVDAAPRPPARHARRSARAWPALLLLPLGLRQPPAAFPSVSNYP